MIHQLIPNFELTVIYLKKYYNIISLFHYNDYLQGKKSIPKESIIITLDEWAYKQL